MQKGAVQVFAAIAIFLLVLYIQPYLIQFSSFGYLGVFLISLVSSATLFLPAPGWVSVIALGKVLDPFLVGICAGVGSGLGEITAYLAGSGARNIAHYEQKFAQYISIIRKYEAAAVFVFAFIPNPLFDVAGIIAGALGIRWQVFIIATVAGRIARYILLAYFGFLIGIPSF